MKRLLCLLLFAAACAPTRPVARPADSYTEEPSQNVRDDDPALGRDDAIEQRTTGTEDANTPDPAAVPPKSPGDDVEVPAGAAEPSADSAQD